MTGQIGRAGGGRARHSDQLRPGDNQGRDSSRRCGKQITNLTRLTALIGLSTCVVLPGSAQTTPTADAAESVSLEQPETFEITPTTGTLKETVQKGQQLIWGGNGGSNDRRFQVTNISIALLRNQPADQVKMVRRPYFVARLSPGGRGKIECHCSHQGRRVDSLLELRHFGQMRR